MPINDALEKIFDADRAMRAAEKDLLKEKSSDALIAALQSSATAALASPDREEAVMRLERLADLCAQIHGPAMADTLVWILNDTEPRVRVAAGEALRDVGYERYAEVARAVERALDANMSGPAMTELPWILAEIGEPSALPLIRRFLGHADADVIAAGMEALVQLGDPEAAEDISGFVGDSRQVIIDDFEQETSTTLDELATEALEILGG